MPNSRFWGRAPQQEYTERRLCAGPRVGRIAPHLSRWWRYTDPKRRDGWHCCACEFVWPEVSPIDGSTVAEPAKGLARTVTKPLRIAA